MNRLLSVLLAGSLLAPLAGAHDDPKVPVHGQPAAPASYPSLGAAWAQVEASSTALDAALAAKDGLAVHASEQLLSGAVAWIAANSPSITGEKATRLAAAVKQAIQAADATHDAADLNDFAKADTARKKLAGALKLVAAQYPAEALGRPANFVAAAADPMAGHDHPDGHVHPAAASEPTLRASVSSKQPLVAGSKAEVIVRLSTKDGKPVTLDLLTESHTEKIHLLIIDGSLTDYHHEHPVATATPGEYAFSFTPKLSGPYRVWADVVPTATKAQEYVIADLAGAGEAGKITNRAPASRVKVDGFDFDVTLEPAQLSAGTDAMGKVTVRGPDGQTFGKLEPVMGAFAHIVGFSEDYKTIAHIHPLGAEPTKTTERGGPSLEFHMNPAQAGLMRLFVQVRIDGKDRFAPITLAIAPAAAKAAASPASRAPLPAGLEAVVAKYLLIQNALAQDTRTGVKEAARELAQAAAAGGGMFDAKFVATAETLAQTSDLKAARAAFRPLSDALIAVTAAKGGGNSGRVEVFCPMAKASWIQVGEAIRNPYYGREMLECGSVKRPL